MKKSFLALSMALVLSIVVAPGSSASVKAGAACKKAGQTTTASGMKFTCVKKGSKLVWGKGVAVKTRPTASAPATVASAAPATPAMSATPAPSKSAEESNSAAPAPVVYTMERVRANNSADYCYTVISGNVYDLTKWIKSHPGGSGAILSLCGKDGTAAYNGMHGNQGKPQSRLAGYLLGPLAK
jgi:cytochrome b involved in lipid metabolism